jgi:hypothetical protein
MSELVGHQYGQAVKVTPVEDNQRDRVDHRFLVYRSAESFLAVLSLSGRPNQ